MKVTEQFEFDASRTGPELSLLAGWPHAAREVLVVATMSFCPAALGSGGPTTKPQWRTVACASFAEVYRLARRGQIAVLVVPADVDPGELSALRTTFPPRYGVLVGPLREGPGLFAAAAALKAEGYIACPEDLGGALRDMAEQACPDPAGDLYIADTANNRAQFVAAATCSSSCPSGLSSTTANDIYTVAGSASGASGSSGDGGAATSALLCGPAGVALDPGGVLYIADTTNNRAQFVAATTCSSSCPWGLSSTTAGHIYTIAGSAAGGSGESGQRGPATSALLEAPAEVALDPSGNLLVADALTTTRSN